MSEEPGKKDTLRGEYTKFDLGKKHGGVKDAVLNMEAIHGIEKSGEHFIGDIADRIRFGKVSMEEYAVVVYHMLRQWQLEEGDEKDILTLGNVRKAIREQGMYPFQISLSIPMSVVLLGSETVQERINEALAEGDEEEAEKSQAPESE